MPGNLVFNRLMNCDETATAEITRVEEPSLNPPYESSDEAAGGEIVSRQLVVKRGDARKVLESTEGFSMRCRLFVRTSVSKLKGCLRFDLWKTGLVDAIFQPLPSAALS